MRFWQAVGMTKRKPHPSAREVLAMNVRQLREGLGLSQERLAERAGFHRTYVSQVELCKANITLDNMEKLALFLGVPTGLLLSEEQADYESLRS